MQETERKIAEVCRRFPEYPFLLTIPGFGPDVSSKVLGALGDPYRFENHRQVLKMAGLDLSADRSGKRNDTTPVISKRGKADLRYGLYHAAVVASTRNPHFIRYLTDKLKGREKERGIGTKMRIKLAAKMLVIAWTLMKKKEGFDPDCIKYVADNEYIGERARVTTSRHTTSWGTLQGLSLESCSLDKGCLPVFSRHGGY